MKTSCYAGFRSPLAESMTRFLEYKRALHFKYENGEKVLRALDRYLVETGLATQEQINSALLDRFIVSCKPCHPRTFNYRITVLRSLLEWMIVQGHLPSSSNSSFQTKPRQDNRGLRPYIFGPSDIKKMLVLVSRLKDTCTARRRAETWRLVIILGYCLGLRVGEIARLRVGDIDLDSAVLLIANTKFSKSRFVPMGPKLTRRLKRYIANSGDCNTSDQVFHCLPEMRAKHPWGVSECFSNFMRKLNLRARDGEREPTFHSLRHSCAVNTLLRWYREGKDPSAYLARLSTFLGHAMLNYTAVYLTITDELLKEANRRFHEFAASSLPEE